MFPERYTIKDGPLNGGMSSVYLCEDTILERKVAIKVLQDFTERRRMADEISALLKLRSKHVVQVLDLVKVGENYAIVQEFIEGHDLCHLPAPPDGAEATYKHLWQIAAGIADIHSAGVIHRDVKPNNMKIDPEGVIKIFDFGLARDQNRNSSTIGFVGTYGFAAPELFDVPAQFTVAVDVYAFGATALHVIAKGIPASLRTPARPTGLPPHFLDQFNTGLSADVLRLLESCLDVNPSRRPSMQIVRDALAKHLLYDKHQALAVHQEQPHWLTKNKRSVTASWTNVASVKISYDGLRFYVAELSGEVYINYGAATLDQSLPESCVVALGAPERGASRKYITFDLSHPEVVL